MTPPRAATWLLLRLAPDPQQNALAGDLHEQYQRGRSPLWYWSQVLTAIVVGAVQDLSDHWLLVGRAIAMWFVLSSAVGWMTITIHQSLGLLVWNWTVNHDFDMLRVFWFGRPRLGVPLLLTVACINSMWIGWLIVRMHRYHAAAVLLTATACVAAHLLFVRYAWTVALRPGTFLLDAPLAMFLSAPFIAPTPFFVGALAVPSCFLMGGLLGTVPKHELTTA